MRLTTLWKEMRHFILSQSYCTYAISISKNKTFAFGLLLWQSWTFIDRSSEMHSGNCHYQQFFCFPSSRLRMNPRHKYAKGNFFLQLKVCPRHVNAVNVIITAWANNAVNNNKICPHEELLFVKTRSWTLLQTLRSVWTYEVWKAAYVVEK